MSLEESPKFCDVFKEVYTILSNSDEKIVKKIPDNIFLSIVTYASKSDLEPEIDMNKELDEQDISEESKSILSIIWYEFACDEEEKFEIAQKWARKE